MIVQASLISGSLAHWYWACSCKGEECIPQTWDMYHEKYVDGMNHWIFLTTFL